MLCHVGGVSRLEPLEALAKTVNYLQAVADLGEPEIGIGHLSG
jgi:hypothetical protein